ncbi:hypothetical protein XM38_025830 [Halomicronema hongdechloris C2206]|uniref:GIY-YIG domain-containing protein n=1 Tax=Halomicronema hongdechloris C2206 TaxID=1641165 RepID=A0A1Z3HMW3_9CYAN|nr:GIY-YIG nuclease family protein [Halomicronema hongdechloris]ASC71630.1 hypothetical protein XM38_025830 [Halomicronema hongdechloris C2206]
MTSSQSMASLTQLEARPYLENGQISEQFQGQVGIYAIFDAVQDLQYVGYSRDVYLSLKQHLVRQPDGCHWVKLQTIARPSRTVLEETRNAWIAENGALPPGNGDAAEAWTQPVDAKRTMSAAEWEEYKGLDDLAQTKYLKKIARRLEAEILEKLQQRGVQMELRFNPKLKETGLLDLK